MMKLIQPRRQFTIEEWRGIHRTDEILILGNGPSAKESNLSGVNTHIIGLNQAWRLRPCGYLCMGDPGQYEMFDGEYLGGLNPFGDSWRGPPVNVFTTETGAVEYAVRIKGLHNDPQHPKRFSFDLTQGIYLNNTIASFGFQLAVWMLGERGTIYLLGIDSDGPQFDGKPMPPGTWENQRETLGYIAGVLSAARPGIQIYDLSPVSKQRVFERKKFEEVFG